MTTIFNYRHGPQVRIKKSNQSSLFIKLILFCRGTGYPDSAVSETVKSRLYKPGCNNLEENKTEFFKLTQKREERKGRVNQSKRVSFSKKI